MPDLNGAILHTVAGILYHVNANKVLHTAQVVFSDCKAAYANRPPSRKFVEPRKLWRSIRGGTAKAAKGKRARCAAISSLWEEEFRVLSAMLWERFRMRFAMVVALAATLAGCVTSPVAYEASLSQQDPKWVSPECQQARMAASDYEVREKAHPGWGFGVLLGPYSLGLVAAIKEHEQKQRKLLSREVHLQCSSLPLPKELQGDSSAEDARAKLTKYP